MINIISRSANQKTIGGPRKVFENLVKGLDKIGYPYIINKNLSATSRLYIQDDISALCYVQKTTAKTVVGPNTFVRPNDIPEAIDLKGVLYLQPCDWAKKIWDDLGFRMAPIHVWPVGIDTEFFRPVKSVDRQKSVLVYHKKRDKFELQQILDLLTKLNLKYNLLEYGQYCESDYLDLLQNHTSFVIWHGCAESQGIGLEEALACNVPILVWDVTRVSQETGISFEPELDCFRVSAVPYFDDSCGIRIFNYFELPAAVEKMYDTFEQFSPREYILKNLSLERQAQKFVQFWENWNLSFDEGLQEKTKSRQNWPPLHLRINQKMRLLCREMKHKLKPNNINSNFLQCHSSTNY